MKYVLSMLGLCLFFVKGHGQTTNVFPTSGNVGIGTTSPTAKLDVRGVDPIFQLYETNSGNNRRLQLRVGEGGGIRFLSTFGTGGNYPFTFVFGGSVGEVMRIKTNGDIGIGTTTPTDKLSVNGRIRAREVKVETANWPDYVFQSDYTLLPLDKLEDYIRTNGHLPGMPTAKQAEAEGIDLGAMNSRLLEKVEELTLHLIRLNAENAQLSQQVRQLAQTIETLH